MWPAGEPARSTSCSPGEDFRRWALGVGRWPGAVRPAPGIVHTIALEPAAWESYRLQNGSSGRLSMRRNTIIGLSVVCVLSVALAAQDKQGADKIPITTTSAEARQLYLKGRDLAEKLRATDARRFYEQAVEKDKNFALAYVGLANTSGTTKEFIDAVNRAASLAGGVSEGERHIIGGLESGLKADPAGTLKHFTELVRLFPNDERAQTLLGNTYF